MEKAWTRYLSLGEAYPALSSPIDIAHGEAVNVGRLWLFLKPWTLTVLFRTDNVRDTILHHTLRMKSADGTAASAPPPKASPPPEYTEDAGPDITASFAQLNLSQSSEAPSSDECIAHLKLLEAFSQLREDIGCCDGLYGLSNSLVAEDTEPELKSQLFAKMREKRWAIYVTIAAMRFEAWWRTMPSINGSMLTGVQYTAPGFKGAANTAVPLNFRREHLPPLGECFWYQLHEI